MGWADLTEKPKENKERLEADGRRVETPLCEWTVPEGEATVGSEAVRGQEPREERRRQTTDDSLEPK